MPRTEPPLRSERICHRLTIRVGVVKGGIEQRWRSTAWPGLQQGTSNRENGSRPSPARGRSPPWCLCPDHRSPPTTGWWAAPVDRRSAWRPRSSSSARPQPPRRPSASLPPGRPLGWRGQAGWARMPQGTRRRPRWSGTRRLVPRPRLFPALRPGLPAPWPLGTAR